MTEEDFRNSSTYRSELHRLLNDATFVAACGIITDGELSIDAMADADALVSVRLLSRRAGMERAFQRLHELATPLPPEPKAPMPDYGHPTEAALIAAEEGTLPPPFQPRD